MFRGFAYRALIAVAGLYVIAGLSGGGITIGRFTDAVFALALIAIGNALVKPLIGLFKVAALPVNLLTFGLPALILSWLLNAAILMSVGHSRMVEGFRVRSFGAALLGSLALSAINTLSSHWVGRREERERSMRDER